jgi:hypothetical protein
MTQIQLLSNFVLGFNDFGDFALVGVYDKVLYWAQCQSYLKADSKFV